MKIHIFIQAAEDETRFPASSATNFDLISIYANEFLITAVMTPAWEISFSPPCCFVLLLCSAAAAGSSPPEPKPERCEQLRAPAEPAVLEGRELLEIR